MTCDFISFSTVFQSYQDDERLIMKGCVQLNPADGPCNVEKKNIPFSNLTCPDQCLQTVGSRSVLQIRKGKKDN